MDKLRPAVLVHVIAEIVVFGILLFLQPVIKITLDPVGCNSQAAALFQYESVELQAGKCILQILTEITEIR